MVARFKTDEAKEEDRCWVSAMPLTRREMERERASRARMRVVADDDNVSEGEGDRESS